MQKYQRLVERRLLTLLAASEHICTSCVRMYWWKESGHIRVRRIWLGLEIASIVKALTTAVVSPEIISCRGNLSGAIGEHHEVYP